MKEAGMIRNVKSVIFEPSGIEVKNPNSRKFNLMVIEGKVQGGPVSIPVQDIKQGGIRVHGNGTVTITTVCTTVIQPVFA